ncbi:CGNR zinc finger domain-containing protein [Glycomyces harbinensis]
MRSTGRADGRRWCSMEDCGAAEKSRRYIAARRTRTAP